MTRQLFCVEWEAPDVDIGASADGYSLHLTPGDAEQFVREFWATAPDLTYRDFGVPTTHPYLVEVPEDVYQQVVGSPPGIRRHQPSTPPFRALAP